MAWVCNIRFSSQLCSCNRAPEFMNELFADPEMQEVMSDPSVMQKLQSIMQNPANIAMYQNDPKIQKIMSKIMGQFGGK